MDKGEVLCIIERFREVLEQQGTRVQELVLFGSYANGTYREGSDIDLVVISPDFESKDYWERINIMVNALMVVWEPIEAIAMTPEEWASGDSMIAQFARSGEIAYSA